MNLSLRLGQLTLVCVVLATWLLTRSEPAHSAQTAATAAPCQP